MGTQEEVFNKFKSNAKQEDIYTIRDNLSGMRRGKVADIWDKVLRLWEFIQNPNVPWHIKAIAVAALLYLVSPIDAVPDFIPIAGLADDVSIILAVIAMLSTEMNKYQTK